MNQLEEIAEEVPTDHARKHRKKQGRPARKTQRRDDALMYLMIGGILLAFSIGLGFIALAIVTNW